jgi:hypothetical protein
VGGRRVSTLGKKPSCPGRAQGNAYQRTVAAK